MLSGEPMCSWRRSSPSSTVALMVSDEREIAGRIGAIQERLDAAELDALLISSPTNFKYLTGFASTFLTSPTRPWFLLVRRDKDPIAVVPEVGAIGMNQGSAIQDIR